MSFGVGQSAMSSIKNNRNLVSKRDRLKNKLFVNKRNKLEFKAEEISPYELKRLGKKLKRENINSLIKRYIVVTLIMFILVLIISYFI